MSGEARPDERVQAEKWAADSYKCDRLLTALKDAERERDIAREAHSVACWGLANHTFHGKDVSLGEEAEAWRLRTLETARERVEALQEPAQQGAETAAKPGVEITSSRAPVDPPLVIWPAPGADKPETAAGEAGE